MDANDVWKCVICSVNYTFQDGNVGIGTGSTSAPLEVAMESQLLAILVLPLEMVAQLVLDYFMMIMVVLAI